jgi:hypothetical protein
MSGWRGAPCTPLPSRGASEGLTRRHERKRVQERPACRRATPREPRVAVCQPRAGSPSGEHATGVGEEAAGGRPVVRRGQAGIAAVVSVSPVEKRPRAVGVAEYGAGTRVPARRTA